MLFCFLIPDEEFFNQILIIHRVVLPRARNYTSIGDTILSFSGTCRALWVSVVKGSDRRPPSSLSPVFFGPQLSHTRGRLLAVELFRLSVEKLDGH